jgi:hypothetical protein
VFGFSITDLKMTKFVGILVMLIGAANLGSSKEGGGPIMLAGLYIVGYGVAGAGGLGIAALTSLPFLGYALAGGVGAFVGVVLVIAVIVLAAKQNKDNLVSKGFAVGHRAVVTDRRYPGLPLYTRLEAMYAFPSAQRRKHESPHDFAGRQSNNAFFQGHNEFEIEVVEGEIETAHGQKFRANLHRVMLHRKPARYRKTPPARVVETKIQAILDNPLVVLARGSVTCMNHGDFPASLKSMKAYELVEGSVKLGNVTFLRLIDESNDSYFYPQSLFSPASICK